MRENNGPWESLETRDIEQETINVFGWTDVASDPGGQPSALNRVFGQISIVDRTIPNTEVLPAFPGPRTSPT